MSGLGHGDGIVCTCPWRTGIGKKIGGKGGAAIARDEDALSADASVHLIISRRIHVQIPGLAAENGSVVVVRRRVVDRWCEVTEPRALSWTGPWRQTRYRSVETAGGCDMDVKTTIEK